MGCETCQDCSCDNITIPVALGETGPAGPTGAAGADGADGSVILFNQVTAATSTSTTLADLTGMTYTIPINQLATTGDQLKLKAYFNTTDTKGSYIDVYLDGNTVITPNPSFGSIPGGNGDQSLRLESVFTRTSNTNVTVEHFIVTSSETRGDITSARQKFISTGVVTDLTGATTILKLRGYNLTPAMTLTCYYMSVEFLNKA